VTIQNAVETADDYGGFSVAWTSIGTYWAFAKPTSGRELYAADKKDSRVTHKVLIRYVAALKETDVAAKHRLLMDGLYYTIDYVENLGKDLKEYGRDFQRLHCIQNGAENE